MKETVIALMIVLGGNLQEAAQFDTKEACEQARQDIKETQSFCYERSVTDPNQVIDDMVKLLERMKQKLQDVSQRPSESI